MADWKKVLVSGSDIHVSSITASNVPGGSSGDEVIVYKGPQKLPSKSLVVVPPILLALMALVIFYYLQVVVVLQLM